MWLLWQEDCQKTLRIQNKQKRFSLLFKDLWKFTQKPNAPRWKDSQNYRLKAFENFKHQCAVCGWDEDERLLEVHHIDSNRSNNELDNLCILCVLCHRKISLGYYSLDITEWKLKEI